MCRDSLAQYRTYRRSPVPYRIYRELRIPYSNMCPAWDATSVAMCVRISASKTAISARGSESGNSKTQYVDRNRLQRDQIPRFVDYSFFGVRNPLPKKVRIPFFFNDVVPAFRLARVVAVLILRDTTPPVRSMCFTQIRTLVHFEHQTLHTICTTAVFTSHVTHPLPRNEREQVGLSNWRLQSGLASSSRA